MVLAVYFGILVCLSGPTCPDRPVVDHDSYYTQADCQQAMRLIAQGMFISTGDKYGYKCVPSTYDPPYLGDKP